MAEQQDRVSSLGDYVAILRRRWQILAVIIPPVLLIAIYTAFSLPAMYRSSATIMLEPSSIPDELVRTTVTSYADQQIELVQRTVMTAERLETVVTDIDPYPELTDYSVHDKAEEIIGNTSLQRVDPVTREPVPESSAFSIFYQNPDPEIAADVTSRIADLFLEYNRETRTAQAREAYDFLLAKSKEVDVQIRALEQQISNFKVQHGDALPESRVRNESSLDRTQRDVDALDSEIRVVEQQESLLKLQLSQISPTITSSGTDVYTQLGQLRAELAAANQKYTPNHPDVKRLTRAIDALAAQANLNTPSTVRPDNPDYLRVQSELQAIQRNLLALRSNVQRARGQMVDYQQRLYQSPTVERDYVQLARDREILQSQFEDIQNKLREAETAQALESQARGERYTLIRSASVPDSPYSPNRLGIILIGIVLGGGLAVGLAAFRESADPTVRNSHDLLEIANVPLIGTIPTLHNDAERRRQRLVWGSVAGVYAVAAIVVTLTVVGANPGSWSSKDARKRNHMSIVDALQRAKQMGKERQDETRSRRLPAPKPKAPLSIADDNDLVESTAKHATIEPAEFPRVDYDVLTCATNHITVPDVEARLAVSAAAPYRMLRTRLLQRCRTSNWSTLAITSPGPGEGKSVTALNLAISIAREGNHDVFLVDLDMRNPSICAYLGVVSAPGNVLGFFNGTTAARDIFFTVGIDRLTIAGSTVRTDQSSELLAGDRLEELLAYIRRVAPNPLILLDLPPIVNTDDALVVAPRIDATVLVASEGHTRRDGLGRAVALLSDFTLAGVILNRSYEFMGAEYYGGAYV